MALSIESIIAIPCCLAFLAHTIGMALPLANDAKRAANVNAYVSTIENHSGYTCRYETITHEDYDVPYVYTCPQKITETLSLAHDFYSLIKRSIDSDGEGDM